MKLKTRTVLASDESEWSTKEVWWSGGRYFLVTRNGGSRGAHQPSDGPNGDWGRPLEGPTEVSEAEALAQCAAMGVYEVEVPE